MLVGLENPFKLIDSKSHKEHIEYILRQNYKDTFIEMVGQFLQKPATAGELEQCLFAIAADKPIESEIYKEIVKNEWFIKQFNKLLKMGHPSLSHLMGNQGQIIRTNSLGFIGGELKFYIKQKKWILDNKSGLYGTIDNKNNPLEKIGLNLKYLLASQAILKQANIAAKVQLYTSKTDNINEIEKINSLLRQTSTKPSHGSTKRHLLKKLKKQNSLEQRKGVSQCRGKCQNLPASKSFKGSCK
jgi:hypothetical protein